MFSPLPAIKTCLLGREGHQRVRVSQALLSWTVYVVFAGVQQIEVLLGLMDAAQSNALTLFNLCGATGFYLLIRSGVNLIVSREPSLGLPQMVFALLGTSWSYAITGPARGAVMVIMMLVLTFGIFTLSTGQARRLAVFGFTLLGGVMLWKGWTAPALYDPRVEAIHFVFAGIVMAAISALAVRLGEMRRRLRAQKEELRAALQRIQALATRDTLTGLLNRRAMAERVLREVRRAQQEPPRSGRITGLVLFDLDHFKCINDTLGHRVGDRVLQAFAELATAELRSGDVLARWGGEEFLLLLPDTSAEQALACVERIRQRLQSWRYEGPLPTDSAEALRKTQRSTRDAGPDAGSTWPSDGSAGDLEVTFSAGLSVCRRESDIEAAIERADQAMYRAKTAGRNRSEYDAGPRGASPAAPAARPAPAASPAAPPVATTIAPPVVTPAAPAPISAAPPSATTPRP